MSRAFLLLSLILLAACGSKHQLAQCKGPLVALNGDLWHPTPSEMAELEKLCPEDN